MVHYKQLDNGIRLIVKQMSGLLSVTMGIIVGTGACVETDEEDGISHFIEHMMFKGTKKRNAFNISDEMDAIGAQVNAFTGKDITCYYAKSTSDHAAEAFEILSDIFLNSTFPADEMKREKGVIIEEISMNEDTPDDLCLDLLSKAFFGEKNYGRNILGPRKNVRGFKKADILSYMGERYTADNIVISMAGNISIEEAQGLVEKYFSSVPRGNGTQRTVEVRLQSKNLSKKKDIEQVHIGIAYPSMKRYEPLADATMIVNAVLGGSMSSRLFQEVREKRGLAYTVYSYLTSYKDTGSLVVYAGVNSDNYLQSVEAIDACINDIRNKNITEYEFRRGKEQLLASQIFAQESTSSQMLLYGKELIYSGNIYNFEERVKKINAVTYQDVLQAIEYNFDEKYRATALVGRVDKHL
ncbi:MAG TPA: insulinase family protein [Candidatus Coproplasma excrementipullorum]|nr:insulinase family protein [Candidatus Coproplasma excrementipullorum]